jgi:hypothetical protein
MSLFSPFSMVQVQKNQLISEAGGKQKKNNRRKGTKMGPGGKTGRESL